MATYCVTPTKKKKLDILAAMAIFEGVLPLSTRKRAMSSRRRYDDLTEQNNKTSNDGSITIMIIIGTMT